MPNRIFRPATPADEPGWRSLWAENLAHNTTTLPDETTTLTWSRILNPTIPMLCHLAEQDGRIVGFATAILHLGTWRRAPICFLEDLYVTPSHRRQGIARTLIQSLAALPEISQCSGLYWDTETNNPARPLYDSLTTPISYIRYRLMDRTP